MSLRTVSTARVLPDKEKKRGEEGGRTHPCDNTGFTGRSIRCSRCCEHGEFGEYLMKVHVRTCTLRTKIIRVSWGDERWGDRGGVHLLHDCELLLTLVVPPVVTTPASGAGSGTGMSDLALDALLVYRVKADSKNLACHAESPPLRRGEIFRKGSWEVDCMVRLSTARYSRQTPPTPARG